MQTGCKPRQMHAWKHAQSKAFTHRRTNQKHKSSNIPIGGWRHNKKWTL